MSLRINHNINSLNAHRNLMKANARVSKSLEKLSSGLRINVAGDGAAELMASEQLRSQVASLDQAIQNSEASISMVQTAEGALGEVNNTLIGMRQLALASANIGTNDDVMLAANQTSIRSMLDSINRSAEFTQFGQRKLLDGSNGVIGNALGQGLEFIGATIKTRSSGDKGYDVVISQSASKSSLKGGASLTQDLIKNGVELTVVEGGKTATYKTSEFDSIDSTVRNFANAVKDAGLDLRVSKLENDSIHIEHKYFGSDNTFSAYSNVAGILSGEANIFADATLGKDLQGTINGEATIGRGNTITGISGNATTDGLTVSYRADQADPAKQTATDAGALVGTVNVEQNALTFQIGPDKGQTVKIAIPGVDARSLAKDVENRSGFKALADIDISTSDGASDSLALIDKAIRQVVSARSELGSFQQNTLGSNIANMQVAKENMVAAESNIRDTDMAAEVANFTRHNMLMQSSAAMLAHSNQIPNKVLRLLE